MASIYEKTHDETQLALRSYLYNETETGLALLLRENQSLNLLALC